MGNTKMNHKKIACKDSTGLGSCLTVDFDISDTDPPLSATRDLCMLLGF
jgi:hypothetical protein